MGEILGDEVFTWGTTSSSTGGGAGEGLLRGGGDGEGEWGVGSFGG